MSATYHVDHTTIDPFLAKLFRAAFPSYSGRMFKVETLRPSEDGSCTMNLRSYWDGGSRDYYAAVELATLRTVALPDSHPYFDRHSAPAGIERTIIPAGVVIVRHTIFCGKDLGLTVHVRPDDRNPALLPPAVTLTDDQRFVLAITASLKAFARDDERRSYGMPKAVWEAVKAECIAAGYLNKAGAITPAGRNAVGNSRRDYYGQRWQAPTGEPTTV